MAFASWYSIRKWLPDCKVFVETVLDRPIFKWTHKAGVKLTRKTHADLDISPSVLVLREYRGDHSPVSSKTNIQSSFIDYSEGCGNFKLEEWINSGGIPFYRAFKRFGTNNMTVNEAAVLNFWESCGLIYRSIGVQ